MKQETNYSKNIINLQNLSFSVKSKDQKTYSINEKNINISINAQDDLFSALSIPKPIRTLEDAKREVSFVKKTPDIKEWVEKIVDICEMFYDRGLDAIALENIKGILTVSEAVKEIQKNPGHYQDSISKPLSFIKKPLDNDTQKKLKEIIDEYSNDEFYMPEEAIKNVSKVIRGERKGGGLKHISESLNDILEKYGLKDKYLRD